VAITENAATARKIFKLLRETYNMQASVRIESHKRFKRTRQYAVEVSPDGQENIVLKDLGLLGDDYTIKRNVNWSLVGKNCCKRAYLRGVFICKGFINRPEGAYHLEIVLNNSRLAADLQKMLSRLGVEARQGERKSNIILYLKESEKIVGFLRIVGASKALLDFENVRIIKSMRNQVNRQVNCETANLAKTVDASLRQVELIKALIKRTGANGIPYQFREMALLRIEYPDSTLKELGALMDPPLSKSGAAYRMRKLEDYAEDLLNSPNLEEDRH
jgi:hypothetical protein